MVGASRVTIGLGSKEGVTFLQVWGMEGTDRKSELERQIAWPRPSALNHCLHRIRHPPLEGQGRQPKSHFTNRLFDVVIAISNQYCFLMGTML